MRSTSRRSYNEDKNGTFTAMARTDKILRKDIAKPWTTSYSGDSLDAVKIGINTAIDEMEKKTIPNFAPAPSEKILHTSTETIKKK